MNVHEGSGRNADRVSGKSRLDMKRGRIQRSDDACSGKG